MTNNIKPLDYGVETRNYYNRDTWDIVWDMIVKANPKLDFTKDQVRLNGIRDEFNAEKNRNTFGVLTGIPEMGREGDFSLFWNRISLRDVFKNDIYLPYNRNNLFISDYLPAFNQAFRFKLSTSDIYDEPVSIGDLPHKIRIRFRESCPCYIGDFELYIGTPKLNIGLVLTNEVLDGLALPEFKLGYYYGPMLYWGTDFTGIASQLSKLENGTSMEGENTELLNRILVEDWVDKTLPADYNLHKSYVYYNGSCKDAPIEVNDTYNNVVIIKLSEDFCMNVSGYLTLHYN